MPLTEREGSLRATGQVRVLVALLALAAGAWIFTVERMEGMDHGPGSDLGTLGFYVVAWVAMMAAMMFPSVAPMVLAYRRVHMRSRKPSRVAVPSFAAGYLVAWTSFGLVVYGLFEVVSSRHPDWLAWERAGRYLAAAVIAGAAAYQLTPAKDACLRRCRGPLEFLADEWRPGNRGALVMGARHGAWCVGCCWALMAALFALGVMSVAWMIVVAALIAVEKLSPWRRPANRGIALLLMVIAAAVAVSPDAVPGLTVPDAGGHGEMVGHGRR